MKEGDPKNREKSEKERQRRKGDYAREGTGHGYRHENTEQVRQAAKSCNRNCGSCPLSKSCTK